MLTKYALSSLSPAYLSLEMETKRKNILKDGYLGKCLTKQEVYISVLSLN